VKFSQKEKAKGEKGIKKANWLGIGIARRPARLAARFAIITSVHKFPVRFSGKEQRKENEKGRVARNGILALANSLMWYNIPPKVPCAIRTSDFARREE